METMEGSGTLFHKGTAQIKSCAEKIQEDSDNFSSSEPDPDRCSSSGVCNWGALMTDDLEKLKLIREAEDASNIEIAKARREYEERLSDFSKDLETEVQNYSLKTQEKFRKNIESFKSDLDKKCVEIRERGKLKAARLSLRISDREIENMVEKALREYIKED